MSGEMWTSLANGFSNLMNILFIANEHNIEVDGFIEGDDGLFGMDKAVIQEKDFEELGFRIKMNYGLSLKHTSFCGNVFDPDQMKIIVAPEQISRLFWSCANQYLHSKQAKLNWLLRAKAMSLYCLGKHTPIAGKLALKVLEIIGEGGVVLDPSNVWWEKNIAEIYKNETFKKVDISDASRALYVENYGITLEEQLLCEGIIDRATRLEDLSFPVFMTSKSYCTGEVFQ